MVTNKGNVTIALCESCFHGWFQLVQGDPGSGAGTVSLVYKDTDFIKWFKAVP